MNSQQIDHVPQPSHHPLKRLISKQNGYGLRVLLTAVLITGIYIHLSILFLGHDLVIEHIVTPVFDMILAIPLTYAAILCWVNIRNIVYRGSWHRFGYGFVTFYFSISVPVHLRTYIVQSTEMLKAFPVWYSALIIPLMIWMFVFVRRLQFKQDTNRNP